MDLRKILLISLGHLSCDLNGGALPSLMPYLAAAHGFNYQAAGALMFAYSATSSLVQPVFGYLADKYCRSWFVPLAVLLAGGSLGLVGFSGQFTGPSSSHSCSAAWAAPCSIPRGPAMPTSSPAIARARA